MRAVGMLRTGFILVLLIISYASTLPLQFLPPIPGYVPVYIRNGDEPLENVNLALAEAFAEHSSSKNLKDSHVALEVQQPVDYEQISNGGEENVKSAFIVFEPEGSNAEKKKDDAVEVETSRLNEALTAMQRRDTNRSNDHKKSEAVTLEVNRSRIPQLLTGQEREDERISSAEVSNVQADQVKKDLETIATELEKSDFKPNEVVDPNPNYPELPAEIPQQHNSQEFGSPTDEHQDIGSSVIKLEESREESASDDSSSELNDNIEKRVENNDSNESDKFEPVASE